MPTQVKVGLTLTIVGYIGLIVSMYLKLEGAVAAAAPLMSAGGVLLGKEWFPQSEHAQQVYSKRPPPPPPVTFTGIVFLASHAAAMSIVFGALTACSQLPTPNDAAAEVAAPADPGGARP